MSSSPYNDVLCELQYYIFNEYNINRYLDKKIKCVIKEKQPIIQCQQKIKTQIFVPTENDTLFWCFYILKNGDSKYEFMYNKNDIVARQIKIEYIEKIRKNKQTVKTYKFDSICNIESNLANDKSLNVKTFLTLCAIENMNILFVNNKTYYELYMNDNKSVYVVYCLNNKKNNNYIGRYGFEINSTEAVDNIKKSLYKIENVDKPIKSISSYKVSDLIDICNKLVIEIKNEETGKNKSKNELYESIIQYF
jgi:hypothetical protein